MSYTAGPIRTTTEPLRRGMPEQGTPLSIQASQDYSGATTPQLTTRRASVGRRTSSRRNSLTIPQDIPAESPQQPHPTAKAVPTGRSAPPKPAVVPPPIKQALKLDSPKAQPAPQPAPRPAPAAPTPTVKTPPAPSRLSRSPVQPTLAAPQAQRPPTTQSRSAPPASAPAADRMSDLRVTPRAASVGPNMALCTEQERNDMGNADVATLLAEKRRLERLSLAVTEEIQSREFTAETYELMPRGSQYYEAETCLRRIAGEAFDFSSPAQLQVALQMCYKNARLSEQNSMFAGAMMSLTSLTNTGTAVESLDNFNRFFAQRDTVMTDTWKDKYVTAMREIVIGFQADPETVLEKFGHHVARLLQHEQLYVALLRYSQGRPLESPAPHLDAYMDSEEDENKNSGDESDDDVEEESEEEESEEEESEEEESEEEEDDDEDGKYYDSSSNDDVDSLQHSPRAVPANPAHTVFSSAAPPATGRVSPSPAAHAARPSSARAAVNRYNDTDGRPPSHSPRVNRLNERAHLTPVVGRGAAAAAASAAVRPDAPPAVIKTMPEEMRRSMSAHSESRGATTMRDRHQDAYGSRGDSPEARPFSRTGGSFTASDHKGATGAVNPFIPPVPRPQAPAVTPQSSSAAAAPVAPRPFSRQGSGTFDAGYFRQSSQNGSLSHSTEQPGFVLRNQEPLSRHATPRRASYSRENSTQAPITKDVPANPASAARAGSSAPTPRSGNTPRPASAPVPAPAPVRAAKPTKTPLTGTARHATAPPANESIDRAPGQSGVEEEDLPPTMSKRQSREQQQSRRQPARTASPEIDHAEKPTNAKKDPTGVARREPEPRGRQHVTAPRASRELSAARDPVRPPLAPGNVAARAPSLHRHGVDDVASPIPGVPDTLFSQRAPSPQGSRANTPRKHTTR